MSEFSIPHNWSLANIADVVEVIRGVTYKKNQSSNVARADFLPVIRANNIQQGKLIFEDLVYVESHLIKSQQIILKDDVVVAMSSGSKSVVGKTAKAESDFNGGFGAFCGLLRPQKKVVYPPLVSFFTRSAYYRGKVSELSAGANINNLKPSHFEEIVFPVLPLAEQEAIVDKLDTLLAQVATTKARLERTLETLKQFRQSVLADAVSGKLTADWRKNNLISEKWEDISFHELILKVRSGSADKPTEDVNGVPILRSSAVRPLSVDYSDVRYLNDVDNLKNENYLRNGDLLFTRLSGSAEYVGNCALVKGVENEYQYPDRLFCARLKDPTHAEYLEYFCNSDGFRQHIYSSIKSSAGHQRITLDVIKKAPISLPPRAEQEEIVIRIKKLFAGADATEQQVNQALERVYNLTQSILAKAFRGELTEQWRKENPELISGDNSADTLLEKIKAERAFTKPKRKTRKKAG
ncbi:restriction endonuclease subunit S [Vibrio alginolyticus]|nr:restriction endonuclease subunit S [Vibrio alginolyticus]ELB2803699.1 restriction endonuclease subunit S [Vibrio alginolyticus]ELB2845588.1 restriction endonuclease subunit S [Vibrio alginolyticus]